MSIWRPYKKLVWIIIGTRLSHWGRVKMAVIFSDDILNCILCNEKGWILIEISLKVIACGPNDNMPIWVRIMVIIWNNNVLIHWRIHPSLVLNELLVTGFAARANIFFTFPGHVDMLFPRTDMFSDPYFLKPVTQLWCLFSQSPGTLTLGT